MKNRRFKTGSDHAGVVRDNVLHPTWVITCGRSAASRVLHVCVTRFIRSASRKSIWLLLALQIQEPQSVALSTGTTGAAFLGIRAVRELADGRTLVVDRDERAVVLFDWASQEVTKVGRLGDGPGEYRNPGQLVTLSADSTLLTDIHTGKWLLMSRARIVTTFDRSQPLPRFAGPILAGADTAGRVLVLHGSHFQNVVGGGVGPRSVSLADSLAVIVVNRRTVKPDTLARVRGPFLGATWVKARAGGMTINYQLTNPLAVGDQAILFPDGWIAIAQASPYHVAWWTPNGTIVRGRPMPNPKEPVDERVKRLAIDEAWGTSSESPKFRSTDFPPWPAVVPPFLRDALIALPDGRVAIKRTSLDPNNPIRYDIVDRRGSLSGVLRLPRNERLVGSGHRSVYVAVTDSDQSEHLRRHAWP